MMKMRRIIAILCTAAMLLSVTACGGKETGSKPSDEKSSVSSEPTVSEEASSKDSSVAEESKESDESSESNESSKTESIDEEISSEGENTPDEAESGTSEETEAPAENLVDGMRPEFKEAIDSYEAFFDEYCEFMKKYNESPDDLTLLTQYAEYIAQYTDTMSKMEALDDGEMNDAETKYYIEVTSRINQKLLEIAL